MSFPINDTTVFHMWLESHSNYHCQSAVRNYTLFETLSLANLPFKLLASNKLNARTKRKTECFSF